METNLKNRASAALVAAVRALPQAGESRQAAAKFPEPADPLIVIEEVMRMTGFRKTTVYRAIKHRGFPKPIKYSPKMARWKRSEVQAFIDRLAAERDAA